MWGKSQRCEGRRVTAVGRAGLLGRPGLGTLMAPTAGEGRRGSRTTLVPSPMEPEPCHGKTAVREPLPHSGAEAGVPQSGPACLLSDISGLGLVRARTSFPLDAECYEPKDCVRISRSIDGIGF